MTKQTNTEQDKPLWFVLNEEDENVYYFNSENKAKGFIKRNKIIKYIIGKEGFN